MKSLAWLAGLIEIHVGLMLAYTLAPAWRWVWWSWLALWCFLGVVVALVSLVRAAMARGLGSARLPKFQKKEGE